jgi:outer membrane protein assembly factor BamB
MSNSLVLRRLLCWGIALVGFICGRMGVASASGQNENPWAFLVADKGRVYTQTRPGRFVAVDAKTGVELWSFESEDLHSFTKPVIRSDALFVAATTSSSGSDLIRLDVATGKTDWRVPFVELGGNAFPVVCDTVVMMPDYWHRTVSAFDVRTGRTEWKTDAFSFLLLFPPAVQDENAIFLAADKKEPEARERLMTISCKDGQPGRTLPVQIGGASRTPVLLYRDSVVLSGYDVSRGTSLKALRISDGTVLWSTLVPDEITRFSPSIAHNLLIAGALSLWAIDLETGTTALHKALPTASVPVTVAGDLVFLSSGDQTVEARQLPSGRLRWKRRLKGKISSNIAVADNYVYVKTGESELARLRLAGQIDGYFHLGK